MSTVRTSRWNSALRRVNTIVFQRSRTIWFQHVAVMVAVSNDAALAAQAATTTIPIVFGIGGDPVKLGLVPASTGPAATPPELLFHPALEAKRLGLLHEMVPRRP